MQPSILHAVKDLCVDTIHAIMPGPELPPLYPIALQVALALACRHAEVTTVCSVLCVSKTVKREVLDTCSGPGNSSLKFTMDEEVLELHSAHIGCRSMVAWCLTCTFNGQST